LAWSALKPTGNPPPPRHSHGAVLIGKQMFVFCGTDGKAIFNDVYVLDVDSLVWSKPDVLGSIPARMNAAVCVYDKKIFVHGGSGASGLLGDLYVFDTGL
jgi:N-acetylneuraminic acid mutarotase